jgi:cardiolipin synthase
VAVIAVLPVVGIAAYILFGETSIGRRRIARAKEVLAGIPPTAAPSPGNEANLRPEYPDRCAPLFRLGETINGFLPVGGNSACLTADSNAAIDDMVADMDAARDHIHLTFYIWLADNNGLKVVEALKRAAGRGVTCRAMADNLGSRAMIASRHWRDMRVSPCRSEISCSVRSTVVSISAITERSWSSTIGSRIAAARTARTPSSASSPSSRPGWMP